MKKITLHDKTGHKCDKHSGCRTVVLGTGKKNYQFPSVDELVRKTLERAAEKGEITYNPDEPSGDLHLRSGKRIDVRDLLGIKPRKLIVPGPDDELGKILLAGADGLQGIMATHQFDGQIEQRFGDLEDDVVWAREFMPDKYKPAAESLYTQLMTIKERYSQTLPLVVKQLAEKNPEVPLPVLIQHAIKLLDEQLMQILFILNVYADSFGQRRNKRRADELACVSFFYEQAFELLKELLDTDSMKVGDVFLARFTAMGLSTIPGAKGPIGAHSLQVPFNMQEVLMLFLPLLAHEFRHNFFWDIDGLEEEIVAAVQTDIGDAVESGELPLVEDTIALGEDQVPAGELLAKMVVDSIGEIDADIAGGVLLSGPAYLYNMVMSFPAMMISESKVSEAKKLLRTSSVYMLVPQEDGSHALMFEPHPPDYIRCYIVAAALDEIGFSKEADQLRELADFAVGEVPEFITWTHAEQEVDMTIRIPVADIKAAAPIIAKTLIRKKFASLGDQTTFEVVNWTTTREEKVQELKKRLVKGWATIPAEIGTVYGTYIGAAATLAYWELLVKGEDAVEAAKKINRHAMRMMKNLQKQSQDS